MLSFLLEIQDDEHPFRNAFLLWATIVLCLVLYSRYLRQRDRAVPAIDPAAAGRAREVRQRRQQERADAPAADAAPEGSDAAPASAAAPAPAGDVEDCPICLDKLSYPVETNCAHTFCAPCFLQYHEQGGGGIARSMVRCPCCRRNVDLIAPTEPGWSAAEQAAPRGRELAAAVAAYTARFSGEPRSWAAAAQDTPHLLRRLWRELSSGGPDSMRVISQLRFWALVLTAGAYLLSPFDLIPELVFGLLGYLDDLLVVGVVAVMVASTFRNAMRQSAAQLHRVY